MAVVRFLPTGITKTVRDGVTVIAAANRANIPIGQSCNGEGICGWCRVTVLKGQRRLSPPTDAERTLMREKSFEKNERAACLARLEGDVTITTSYW